MPKTVKDEIASLDLPADLKRSVSACLQQEVARRCDDGSWPPLVGRVRYVTFNLTESPAAGELRWHHFAFFLVEAPSAEGRYFDVMELHYQRDD
jgi:hypothetical protein